MKLGELRAPQGAVRRPRRRGRGESSGRGKTSGRGTKGQRARSGPGLRPEFEGGQTPLVRRIPKRGFTGPPRDPIQIVNVGELNRFEAGSVVDPALLKEQGLIDAAKYPVKVLGDGELTRPLTVRVARFSKSAREKILAAGGSAEQAAC